MFDFSGYVEAESLTGALEALANDNAMVIAGGTDVLVKMRERRHEYVGRDLVGITRVPGMKELKLKSGDIYIGAACSFTLVENHPLVNKHANILAMAAGNVGGPQIRNIGTIGGNICNGAPSADTAPALLAMNAVLVIESRGGQREVPIQDFYIGPGKVALDRGELLLSVKITSDNYEGYKGHVIKFAQRNAMDIATLNCAVWFSEKYGVIEDMRIAFGVAGPTPLRAVAAENFARGKVLNEHSISEICAACLEDTRARDSWRASKAFREQLITELPARAIALALTERRSGHE